MFLQLKVFNTNRYLTIASWVGFDLYVSIYIYILKHTGSCARVKVYAILFLRDNRGARPIYVTAISW